MTNTQAKVTEVNHQPIDRSISQSVRTLLPQMHIGYDIYWTNK